MSGHTPTPWTIKNGEAIKIVEAATGDNVATLTNMRAWTRRPTNEVEANAAFIVKAVNAYDDLVACLQSIERMLLQEPDEWPVTIAQIRAALAKAGAAS